MEINLAHIPTASAWTGYISDNNAGKPKAGLLSPQESLLFLEDYLFSFNSLLKYWLTLKYTFASQKKINL